MFSPLKQWLVFPIYENLNQFYEPYDETGKRSPTLREISSKSRHAGHPFFHFKKTILLTLG